MCVDFHPRNSFPVPVCANTESVQTCVCVCVCVCVREREREMQPVVCADQKTVADCAHPGLFLGHAELSGNREL